MPDDDSYGADEFAAEDFEPGTDGLEDTEAEDDGILDASDTLDGDPGDDPLDTGIIPPDRWSAGERFGTTLAEEREGESLEALLAEEQPEPDPYAEDEADPEAGLPADGPEPYDEPQPRAGRLVSEDEGAHPDTEADLVARDVGIDGGAAGAEEAAIHVEDEGENPAIPG